MENAAIIVKELYKVYNSDSGQKNALSDLNLTVPKGKIFGLLGPNGAGKSSLINILAGLVNKTSGYASIMGIDIDILPKQARSLIGVVPQEIFVDSFFSLKEALEFYAGYYGIRPEQRRTNEILKSLSLYDKRNNLPKELSGGMKRRFLIAKALVHNPPVLILDEPTAGVDIELRDQLWEFIREQKAKGTTIILTTHYLGEAQNLCDEIAFISGGSIIKQDTKENLLSELSSRHLNIEFENEIDDVSKFKNYQFQQIAPNKLRFDVDINDNKIDQLLRSITESKNVIHDINVKQPDLEDVFYNIVKSNK